MTLLFNFDYMSLCQNVLTAEVVHMEVVQGVHLNTMQLSIQVNALIAAVQLEADVLEVLQNHILLGPYKNLFLND